MNMESVARQVFENAVLNNDLVTVKFILQFEKDNIDVNRNFQHENYNDPFPLLLACGFGDEVMVELFITLEADVNKQDSTGTSALMVASQLGYEKIVQLLLNNSAINVDLENETGQTALMFACYNGHSEIVELFLKGKVSVNKTNNNGMTALMLAVCEGHTKVVGLLRQYSVKLDGRLVLNVSALDIAKAKGHHELCAELFPTLNQPNDKSCGSLLQPAELARVLDIIVRDTDRNEVSSLVDCGRQASTKGDPLLPSLGNTFSLLLPICSQWQNIALLLNVSDVEVKAIESRYSETGSNLDCLREVLRACFAKAHPTWKTLEDLINSLSLNIESKNRESIIRIIHQAMPKNHSPTVEGDSVHDSTSQLSKERQVVDKSLDLRKALMITYKMAAEWNDLGVFLGIDTDTLDTIKSDNYHIAKDCLRVMLDKWLKKGSATCNWESLKEAVELIRSDIAENIAKKYLTCNGCS